MKTKLIEDLEREFPEQMKDGRNYQVTVEDLQKLFKILDENIFRKDFENDEISLNVIEYTSTIKVKGCFNVILRNYKPIAQIVVVKYSSDRFSHIVSVLCHEMIHMYDFKHGKLSHIYDEYGDLTSTEIEGKQFVHGYNVHGDFFKMWMTASRKHGLIVNVKYNIRAKELIKMSDTNAELPKDTPFADLIFGKREITEDVDDPAYKARLEAFAKCLKGTNVEFKYYDKGNWIISFD